MLALSDPAMLSVCSTTPEYEPETFIPEIRAAKRWRLEQIETLHAGETVMLPVEEWRWVVEEGGTKGCWEVCDARGSKKARVQ